MEQIEQNTCEWLDWRRKGVGASEVPVLMGESEYQTPREIWKIKTGRTKEQESNWAMSRGADTEPKIRALYELHNDVDMPATLAVHSEVSHYRASLDGYNADQRVILEIKYPGKEKHEQAKSGVVPSCYYGQVQYQLMVTGALRCDYVSFDGENISVVQVFPDNEYIERMKPVVDAFWQMVLLDIPPPLTDRDYMEEASDEVKYLLIEFKTLKSAGSTDRTLAPIREKISSLLTHPRYRCEGVRIVRNKKGVCSFTLETA